jgi:hypothetical protein
MITDLKILVLVELAFLFLVILNLHCTLKRLYLTVNNVEPLLMAGPIVPPSKQLSAPRQYIESRLPALLDKAIGSKVAEPMV